MQETHLKPNEHFYLKQYKAFRIEVIPRERARVAILAKQTLPCTAITLNINLVLGNFNAHSPLWGSDHQTQAGRHMEDFIVMNNLIILNTGDPTYFNVHSLSTSNIDLSQSSLSLPTIFSWSGLSSLYGSDPYPLQLTPNTVQRQWPQKPKWLTEKADWHLFKESIKIPDLGNDAIKAVDIFTQ